MNPFLYQDTILIVDDIHESEHIRNPIFSKNSIYYNAQAKIGYNKFVQKILF